ncbi:hypothetical protein RJ639_030357 [Escallonia herrerae]|uniref:UBX domain-containing protein n=1 Tax=Escallonia herrerae TaxID=1293975 RepID=A0AA88X2P1_9ASTE|nr:hypothetical protein RJ639_030357 [Escallonia herrerae]
MSSMMRGSARARGEACDIVRRMVSLPRSILGGFSRAMGQGIDRVGIRGRRNQNLTPNFPLQHPQFQEPSVTREEWAFLESFEQQYGTMHPFFYACQFVEALRIAQEEHKFVFMYLHSPEHPFTPYFCRETLCSELVVQFIDANFVSWGALANKGEGLHMTTTLRPASFPFCAVVAPGSGDSIALLQQMEGPVSPAEMIEILQRTMEEQGLAFGSARAKEEEKRRVDRRLREEQDAAYLASLQIDQEKEKIKNFAPEGRLKKQAEDLDKVNYEKAKQKPAKKLDIKPKEVSNAKETQHKAIASERKDAQTTQILIRFPNGERKEQSFLSTDKIQVIYRYIDSLGLPGTGSYKLVSSFPRKVYGVDQIGMTLKDAGFHPRATLFLEHF